MNGKPQTGATDFLRQFLAAPDSSVTVREACQKLELARIPFTPGGISGCLYARVYAGEFLRVRIGGHYRFVANRSFTRAAVGRPPDRPRRERGRKECGAWPVVRDILAEADDSLSKPQIQAQLKAMDIVRSDGLLANMLSEHSKSGEIIANWIDGRRCYTLNPEYRQSPRRALPR